MELLPALPYTTLIEEYILYAIAFVAAAAASNAIMLLNVGYDDESEVKFADRISMFVSGFLWIWVWHPLCMPDWHYCTRDFSACPNPSF